MEEAASKVKESVFSWRVGQDREGVPSLVGPTESATMAEANRLLPEGAYTTLRTYGGTGLILLDSHLDRLETSAHGLGCPVQLDRPALRRLLCELLRAQTWASSSESRLRLTLDCTRQHGDLWLTVEALPVPSPNQQREGVAVLTRPMQRTNPTVKGSAFIAASHELRTLLGGRIDEVLMVGSDGCVLEGLSSNFFGIRDGTLHTADEGVLPGLTRAIVLQEADRAGIPVRFAALPAEGLTALDEAFLSSTSRAILPVVEIDGQAIGGGKPGPLTRDLAGRFQARLQGEIESVCAGHAVGR